MKIQVNDSVDLVEITLTSAETIFRAIQNNREHLRKWLPFVDMTRKVEDTREFLKSVLEGRDPHNQYIFEIRLSDVFIGLIGLKDIDRINKKTEIGYWITAGYEGKGIMTESCRKIIQYAFEEFKMHRITIKTATGNSRSKKIPERLGFTPEGIERAGEYLNGEYVDLIVFSLLEPEWQNMASKGK